MTDTLIWVIAGNYLGMFTPRWYLHLPVHPVTMHMRPHFQEPPEHTSQSSPRCLYTGSNTPQFSRFKETVNQLIYFTR